MDGRYFQKHYRKVNRLILVLAKVFAFSKCWNITWSVVMGCTGCLRMMSLFVCLGFNSVECDGPVLLSILGNLMLDGVPFFMEKNLCIISSTKEILFLDSI